MPNKLLAQILKVEQGLGIDRKEKEISISLIFTREAMSNEHQMPSHSLPQNVSESIYYAQKACGDNKYVNKIV